MWLFLLGLGDVKWEDFSEAHLWPPEHDSLATVDRQLTPDPKPEPEPELPLPPSDVGVSSYEELSDDLPPPPPASPSNTPYRVIAAFRGNVRLVVGPHLFIINKQRKERAYWRCMNKDCCSRLCTVNGSIIKRHSSAAHNHPPVPGQAEVEIMLSKMKERAANTSDPINHIVDDHYAKVEVGWTHLMPSVDAVKRALQRARQRAGKRKLT